MVLVAPTDSLNRIIDGMPERYRSAIYVELECMNKRLGFLTHQDGQPVSIARMPSDVELELSDLLCNAYGIQRIDLAHRGRMKQQIRARAIMYTVLYSIGWTRLDIANVFNHQRASMYAYDFKHAKFLKTEDYYRDVFAHAMEIAQKYISNK